MLQNITGLYRVPNTRYMCCWVTGEIACRQIQQAGDDALIDCLCREILPAYVTPAHGAQAKRIFTMCCTIGCRPVNAPDMHALHVCLTCRPIMYVNAPILTYFVIIIVL